MPVHKADKCGGLCAGQTLWSVSFCSDTVMEEEPRALPAVDHEQVFQHMDEIILPITNFSPPPTHLWGPRGTFRT